MITSNTLLQYFEKYGLDCDFNIAKEIVSKTYKNDYFSILYLYGEEHLLLLLQMLEELEEYEMCCECLKQIKEQNKINKNEIRERY